MTSSREPGSTMSVEALRALVVEAGLELLNDDGLGLVAESISYARVFSHLEREYSIRVTRGSVHERIWASQDDFRSDVLIQTMDNFRNLWLLNDFGSSAALLQLDGSQPDHQVRIADFSRRVGRALWDETIDTSTTGQVQSMKAIAAGVEAPTAESALKQLFAARLDSRLDRSAQIISPLMRELNLRVRPELGLSDDEASRIFYLTESTLLVGANLSYWAGCGDLATKTLFRGAPNDPAVPWSTASIWFKALLDFLTEPDTEGRPSSIPEPPPRLESEPVPGVIDAGSANQRRSRNELRRLVLAAGEELLLRDGLQLRPEVLRYSVVLAHIKNRDGLVVNRASVHRRLWDSNDEYCAEVLTLSIRRASGAIHVGWNGPDVEPVHNPDGTLNRRQMAFDFLRVVIDGAMDVLRADPNSHRRLLIKAALLDRDNSPGFEKLAAAVQETEQQRNDVFKRLLRDKVLSIGIEVRPSVEMTVDEALNILTTVVQGVATGAIFNHLAGASKGFEPFGLKREDGSGRSDDWTVSSMAARACFDLLFFDPVADSVEAASQV